MKKLLSLLLAMTLLVGLMACGAPKESVQVSKTENASVDTPEETADVLPEEPAANPDASAVESMVEAEAEVEPVVYELPLTDSLVEFEIYTTSAPGFMTPYIGTDGSYNTADATVYFEEQTGVRLKYTEIDMFSFSQNFNLMIASGDYPDILTGMAGSYAGGVTKALDDEVIIDLTDYVLHDMPAYAQKLDERDAWKEVMTDEGQILGIYGLNSEAIVDRGPVVRQDWLDEQGLEAPVTYDELTEMGKTLMSAYDLDYAFYVSSVVNPSITLSAGFDLPGLDITATGTHFYQEDGEVKSCLVSDNLKDYLKYLNGWYNDGLISKDFFSRSSYDVKDVFAGDGCAVCWDNADYITEDNRNAELIAKGFHCAGLPVTLKEEGQELKFMLGMDGLLSESVSISTTCEDPDLLIKAMDWCFTREGELLCNYGIEGKSYDLDENGDAVWSPNVTDVEDVTFRAALVTYTLNSIPTCWDMRRYWPETYDEDAYAAVEMWSAASNSDGWSMPSSLFYTSEESAVYATKVTDVETYANEFILSAVIGEKDIDASWTEYVDTVWSLGLQECLNVQQNAYDRYQTRGV